MFLFKNYKKGSVILVVAGIIFVLLLLFSSFMKSTTSRMFATKKLSDIVLAREFASSLAILANHYIKNNINSNDLINLKNLLSLPLEKFLNESSSKKEEEITNIFKTSIIANVKSGSDDILTLLENNSGLNFDKNKKWKVSWILDNDDFSPILLDEDKNNIPYPREKKGRIRIKIEVTHIPPGSKSSITEDYIFFSDIKIVANLLPVLSKFTFYVENAMEGETPDEVNTINKFNVVKTDENGNLSNDSLVAPWIFNNGQTEAKPSYDDLVNDERGFIYLGGGNKDFPIKLGLACGWGESPGECGEDFHFYMNEDKQEEGYWKTFEDWGENGGILVSEIGICGAIDGDYKEWRDQLSEEHKTLARRNSIFKLFGSDSKKSPTLVLGYVDSMFASVRIYKESDDSGNSEYFEPLTNLKAEDSYKFDIYSGNVDLSDPDFEIKTLDPDFGKMKSFFSHYTIYKGGNLNFDTYISSGYPSCLSFQNYNKDYTYIYSGNKEPYPIQSGAISDNNLKDLCTKPDSNLFYMIPNTNSAKYNNIYSNVDLKKLKNFIDVKKLGISGSEENGNIARLVHSTKRIYSSDDAEKYFSFLGLLKESIDSQGKNIKELNLNGWTYLCHRKENSDSDETQDINLNSLNIVSPGGIILSKGDIHINGDITGGGSHFTIIALEGNIYIGSNVKKIDASLIAAQGQVRLEGKHISSKKLEVNGNIVMAKIPKEYREDMKRGLNLNYKNELSALPYTDNDDRSEKNLLMFHFNDDVDLLE